MMRRRRMDDSGVAAVVGFILVFAVAIGIFASTVTKQVPKSGKESERSWDDAVADAFRRVDESLSVSLQNAAPGTVTIPPAPAPKAIEIPILGRVQPASASGNVAFAPSCAGFTATHVLPNGTRITDLWGGSNGCLAFRATPAYSKGFGDMIEFGGVLRVQGGLAAVVQGPPLDLALSTPTVQRVALGLPGLRGQAVTLSADSAPVRIDLVPGPAATETEAGPNAVSAQWTLATEHPVAWKTWFAGRIDQAQIANATVSCQPATCAVGADGRGYVVVDLAGPVADPSVSDIRLSVVYGLFDVGLR